MVTVTDLFAGAGGSSTGAASVPDVEVVRAANHWPLAVDVHAKNFPRTVHACVDLHMEDPRNFPRTDLLWASPECTKWSQANAKATALSVAMGGDPTLFDDVPTELQTSEQEEIDRSRLLMFDVLRFVEYHRYRAVIIENVVDVAMQAKYTAAWRLWQRKLRGLGYDYRVVSLNSMHAQMLGDPAPQSRDRLYIVAWPEGEKAPDIDRALRPRAWCHHCELIVESRQAWKPGRSVGRYRAQYIYVCSACQRPVEPGWLPASTAIDWTLRGERIADRKRPLSDKTMARIREGLRRYAHEFLVQAGGNSYDATNPRHPRHGEPDAYYRAWPVTEPLRTLMTDERKGLIVPSGGTWHETDYPHNQPLRTVTTPDNPGLLVPVEGREGKNAQMTSHPLRTQTTRNETAIVTMLRGQNAPKLISDPLDTLTASGTHHGLLVPYYSASQSGRPATDPLGTLTTVDRYALIQTNTHHNRARHVREPAPTLTTATTQFLLEPRTIDPMECEFRMLQPHEIAAGMAFPANYQWAGTGRERVRLAGAAVTPPSSRDLIGVVVESVA